MQGWRKWSTGLIGLCSPGGRQECLPYLNACRYLCTFTEMLQREAGEVKTGILRNKANKSNRINISAWEEVQKATKKSNEIPTRSP